MSVSFSRLFQAKPAQKRHFWRALRGATIAGSSHPAGSVVSFKKILFSLFLPRIRRLVQNCSSTFHQKNRAVSQVNSSICHFGWRTAIRQHLSSAQVYPLLRTLVLAPVIIALGTYVATNCIRHLTNSFSSNGHPFFSQNLNDPLSAAAGFVCIKIIQNQMRWNSTIKYFLETSWRDLQISQSSFFNVLFPPAVMFMIKISLLLFFFRIHVSLFRPRIRRLVQNCSSTFQKKSGSTPSKFNHLSFRMANNYSSASQQSTTRLGSVHY